MATLLPPPVQVRFIALYEPDMVKLGESLVPFGRWSDEHVAAELPVEITYPDEINKRIEVLRSYVADAGCSIPAQAGDSIRQLLQMIPEVDAAIAQGVRLVAGAAIWDDGSRATNVRDTILSTFLAAKMLAVARLLKSFILVGEAPLNWGPEFYEMKTVWSSRLIFGLSYVTRNFRRAAGWTDANLFLGAERHRLFMPIFHGGEYEKGLCKESYLREEIHRIIIPQLLDANSKHASYLTIRALAFEGFEGLEHALYLRFEVFLDNETYTDHSKAKEYILRIASDRIASQLQQIPIKERQRQFFLMTYRYQSSLDVLDRVRKKVALM